MNVKTSIYYIPVVWPMDVCQSHADNVFGPIVIGCREQFDFTLLFEQLVFSIIPTICVLPATGYCIAKSLRHGRKTERGGHRPLKVIKLLAFLGLIATQLALVILWSGPHSHSTTVSVAASALSLAACLMLATLSWLAHDRLVKPSALLNGYLALGSLLDLAQARTLWLRRDESLIPAVFSAGVACKASALVFEMAEKRKILKPPYQNWPPEVLAGIFNRAVFWWLNPLLLNGSRTILGLADLFDLDQALTSESLWPRFQHINEHSGQKQWPLVLRAMCTLWRPLFGIVVPRLLLIGFKICQPVLIARAVTLLSEPSSQKSNNTGRALIGATALIYTGIALTSAAYQHRTYRLITMVRGGLVGLIYDASFRLSANATDKSAAVTLVNTDIDRIAAGFAAFDNLWAGPIELAIALYLLSRYIGLFCFAPALLILIVICGSIATSRYSAAAQKSWVDAVEHRVATTASILGRIKGIKMMGLSGVVQSQLHDLRAIELQASTRFRILLSLTMIMAHLPRIAIPVLTLLIYILATRDRTGIYLDPAFAFTTISLCSFVSETLNSMSRAGPDFAAAVGCFDRIQRYLDYCNAPKPEALPCNDTDEKRYPWNRPLGTEEVLVEINGADLAYHCGSEPSLRNITLTLRAHTWTALVGPVGSGKSTLLLGILNELSLVKGSFHRQPSLQVAYCAQDAWLPRMSIQDIIVGYSDMDRTWYETVLAACLLQQDIRQLPNGDETVVGSRGGSLSGGQKQRLSLARALYSRKPLLLLDDVLSGLDQVTEKAMLENVCGVNGLCRRAGMTVVLATHTVRHAQQADQVIWLAPDGIIRQQRALKELYLCQGRDSPEPDKDTKVSTHRVETPSRMYHSAEDQSDGISNDRSRQTGDIRLYSYYFRAMGWDATVGVLVCDSALAFVLKLPSLMIKWWSNAEQQHPGAYTDLFAGVFGSLNMVCLMLIVIMTYLLLHIGLPRSSINLHAILLRTVMGSPFWFFVATDSGQVLNRFSQDMSLIAMELPLYLHITLFDAVTCIVETGLILSTSKWAALACPGVLVILYLLQKFYLRTSRQLRLLDLEAKSPLYSHIIETLEGLVTARAFKWQTYMIAQNQKYLDESQRPFYLLYSIQRWLNLVLDLVVAALATIIMALATQLPGTSAGALGLSLVNILSFSENLASLIRSWTELETSLGAVSRVRSFESNTPSEYLPPEKLSSLDQWPSQGEVILQDISVSYRPGSPAVLEHISLRISAGEKVGICGRTGSGKSSFILALLRLAEIEQGDIILDGIPISSVPREVIRRAIATIPQEPSIIPGTVRLNMDPFKEHPDDALVQALEEVGIWEMFLTQKGLDTDLQTSPLSRGEEQLLCLARALVRQCRIVILDEVTASVDVATEARMIEVMRRRLIDCTVIAIAHRLHTIRQFDRIVVLDQGRMVECGTPEELLRQPSSYFRRVWDNQSRTFSP